MKSQRAFRFGVIGESSLSREAWIQEALHVLKGVFAEKPFTFTGQHNRQ
ncbi:MAG TPA: hypothetical protein VED37_15410 [Ktedonobacteraceae bacterium]|nr:hypothetical protein [Ktedonobacteraceae bacterium]